MVLKIKEENILTKNIFSDIQKQFPQEEIKTFEEYNTLLMNTNYKLGLVFDNEVLVGYILYFVKDYIWVDYIAVLKEYHSKGFGSKILKALFDKYTSLQGCYFEVEPEVNHLPQTVRRMIFYKKLGCIELDFKYYFPNPIKQLEMKLLYKSFNGKIPAKEEIKKHIADVFNILHASVKCKKEILNLINMENP